MEKFRSASVPHIKFESPRKPFPHFSFHTRVMQCGWKHSGKFALLFSALVILSILLPYTFALIAGNVRPLLPLIRCKRSVCVWNESINKNVF
ncbi:hypothetical protein HNY73_005134 [Argiope bruennichi]|uniref:Uncharacterized protein n=1 Tax=Argiope bruennichi TaxID=94029 RepID=A0A8T0FHY9_ARGBR|nr:hypothetical protein HNY73_005134 [Argiope bruennichi]